MPFDPLQPLVDNDAACAFHVFVCASMRVPMCRLQHYLRIIKDGHAGKSGRYNSTHTARCRYIVSVAIPQLHRGLAPTNEVMAMLAPTLDADGNADRDEALPKHRHCPSTKSRLMKQWCVLRVLACVLLAWSHRFEATCL